MTATESALDRLLSEVVHDCGPQPELVRTWRHLWLRCPSCGGNVFGSARWLRHDLFPGLDLDEVPEMRA